ncbi:PREDICTED: glutathione [Prunus dulcis]|uniref:glutathione transferase n=2 Tax=Prunus dulcis TaxID=3755 RepID=A0A5E4FRV3_PRUDU|nr:glutathione S-transferase T1 isoform X1 [Prunus dulcis]VVA30080.1 PREDICTED: glutathione [Prunus dulcis]
MKLKVYVDRMSQPSRAILIFLKANGIEFEEVKIDIAKRQHKSPEFKKINPMGQVPAISDGRFNLFESHAILTYLACAFPGIADSWYPSDLFARAKINSVLDWHHSNLRRGSATFVLHTVLAPVFGLPSNPQAAAEAETLLSSSLSTIESIWLKGNGKFLLGGFRPSIADLSLVCEIMQLELLEEKDRSRILDPHTKVLQWIENTKNATRPHFYEVHDVLFRAKTRFQEQRLKRASNKTDSSDRSKLPSKM